MEDEDTKQTSSFRSTQLELKTDKSKISTVHTSIPVETDTPNTTPATRGKLNTNKYEQRK